MVCADRDPRALGHEAEAGVADHFFRQCPTSRLAPQVLAIQLEEVEGVEEDILARRLAPQPFEHRKPVLIAGHGLAVDQAGAATQLLRQPQLPFQPSSRVATGKSSELRPVSQYTASPTHSCTAVSVRRNPSLTLAKGCSASSTPCVRQSTG